MDYDVNILCGAAVAACCIGMLTGVFGIGGGFLLTPVLMIFLGIPGPIAVGTGLAMISCNSGYAIYKRRCSKTIDYKLAVVLSIFGILGVMLGVFLLDKLKFLPPLIIRGKQHIAAQYILYLVYLFLLTGISIILLIDFCSKKNNSIPHKGWLSKIPLPPRIKFNSLIESELPLIPILFLGLLIGILTGFLGIGGGVILLPILIYAIGQDAQMAVGTSLLIVCFSSLIGAAGHWRSGNINLVLLTSMLIGSFIGTHYGTVCGMKMKDKKLRLYFCMIVIISAIIVLKRIISITF
ncbi:MAG: sulfite exporter TauE/SafE family protein [Phycisphaerales bacterium]